jgi:hypothetical protein
MIGLGLGDLDRDRLAKGQIQMIARLDLGEVATLGPAVTVEI